MNKLSAVIVARDEAAMINGCLQSLAFVDEIVVVLDDRTEDSTEAIVKKSGIVPSTMRFETFAQIKNDAIAKATNDWILLIDADERVSQSLATEMHVALNGNFDGYMIPFDSYFFATKMLYGGWQRDEHIRLFRKSKASYTGDIHEVLSFAEASRIGRLEHAMAHFSHRSITHNLLKTNNYATIQATEMLKAGHPPVRARTLFGVIWREFRYRYIKERGYKDGMAGIIESLYQPFSLFVVYVRLWELQQKPDLNEQYHHIEEQLNDL